MKTNLYIPQKIHVGFQTRADTYTGKLGYVICEDVKGNLRKQASWESWRDSTIEPVVFENKPSRFVFNKGVQRNGYFGSGRSVIRVYDHRDFEFEISVDNLIGILMHSDISKRDILEECVFAWAGKDLVLLPVNSTEYNESVVFTDKQSKKVSAKELVKGYTYGLKSTDAHLVYMGYYPCYEHRCSPFWYYDITSKSKGKKHVFYDVTKDRFETPQVSALSSVISECVVDNFAELDQKLDKSLLLDRIDDVELYNDTCDEYSRQSTTFVKRDGDNLIVVTHGNHAYSSGTGEEREVTIHASELVRTTIFRKSTGDTVYKLNNCSYSSFNSEFAEVVKTFGTEYKHAHIKINVGVLRKEMRRRGYFQNVLGITESGKRVPLF